MSDAAARVRAIVDAARRVTSARSADGATLRARLLETSGLSREGVELALTEHLELDPTPAEIEELLASCSTSARCHVVLAANVCTAALRALAVALATAPTVFVRASRRDPAFAAALVGALSTDANFARAGGAIAMVDEVAPKARDEFHLYGTDDTIAAITSGVERGVVVRSHGAGIGVALITEGGPLSDAAEALACDVVPFDQRGCLSPRFALVEGSSERTRAFAEDLHRALARWDARVPRGALDSADEGELTLYRTTMLAVGACYLGEGHVVGLDLEARSLVLPPALRAVHVAPVTRESALRLLTPWASSITTIGISSDAELERAGQRSVIDLVAALVPRARKSRLGWMQKPRFDGPVDLRQRARDEV